MLVDGFEPSTRDSKSLVLTTTLYELILYYLFISYIEIVYNQMI